MSDSTPDAALMAAQAAYGGGRYAEVLAILEQQDAVALPPVLAQRLHGLRVSALYGLRRYDEAAQAGQALVALAPDKGSAWLTLGLVYCRLGRAGQALPLLRRAEALGVGGCTLHDTLAATLVQTGDLAAALRHGERALLLKDQEACANPPAGRLRRTTPPPFDPARPERNIIAFSLWGALPKYTQGALANARLAPSVYPGWTCRFYVDDTVPAQVIGELRALGGQIVARPRPRFPEEGMLWRFGVSDDPAVDRFLVRDADSEIGGRERRAVEAWIASGRMFHAMRDHLAHTELMLGGLWGGVAGALPPIDGLLAGFPMANHSVLDQVFLRRRVWPLAKDSILVHDGHYRVLGAQPFPAGTENPPGRHVGGGIERQAQAAPCRTDAGETRVPANAASPLVSVIMPAYNAAPFIGEAIRSILNQTFRDFELIVVDDGSTDATAGEVAKFDDPRITFLRNERNLGPAAARNRALDVARGAFIAPMDADDVSLPTRLERNLAWLESRPDCVAVGGSMMVWGPESNWRPAVARIEPVRARRMVAHAPPVNHATCIIRRRAFDAGVRYRPEFDGAEDYRLWLDLLAHGELATEPEVIYHYRAHPDQQTQAGREKVRDAVARVRRAASQDVGAAPGRQGRASTGHATGEMFFSLNAVEQASRVRWTYRGYEEFPELDNAFAFIKTEHLWAWYAKHPPQRPTVLVTGYSDLSVTDAHRRIADHPNIVRWYACNLDMRHPKVVPIPIGVMPSTANDTAGLIRVMKEAHPKDKSISARYTLHGGRPECAKKTGVHEPLLPREDYLRELARSFFCIAPDGMGVDTHRVWEALALRAIPILLKNGMADQGLYRGLPVIQLDRWEDLRIEDCTPETYRRLWGAFDPDQLSFHRFIPELAPARPRAKRVVIVYKTHFDIGYTATAREVVHEYRTSMADNLLDAIAHNSQAPKDRQFVWTLSGYPMRQILWEGQEPRRKVEIEQALRDGNIAVHAYPGSTYTEVMELEDVVRGLGISSGICRRYGVPLSTGAKTSDMAGQSWVLPTALTHAGVRIYHMSGTVVTPSFNLPQMFWWEGPDGSRLLTLYNNDYGTPKLPPSDWPHDTWVYLNMTSDNQGPPSPQTVRQDLDFFAALGIRAQVGTLDDFADLIMREDLGDVPVVRSDLPDAWLHGLMSMPAACKQARNFRPLIGAADMLAQQQRCWGVFRPDLRAAIGEAYERSMRFGEHTFGMANQHYIKQPFGKDGVDWNRYWAEGMSPQARLLEEAWREKAECVEDVRRLVSAPYQEGLLALADQVRVDGGRVVVYNPLPWTRDGEITLNCFHIPAGASLKPVDGGPALPVAYEPAPIEDPTRVRRFAVRDIPPMGYRTYRFSDEPAPSPELAADRQTGVIESPFFKARFDAVRGRIASLVDKRSGRELVDAASAHGFGAYLYQRFGWEQIRDWTAASLYPQYPHHRFICSAYDMPRDAVYAEAQAGGMTFRASKTAIDVTAVMTGEIPGPGLPQKVSIRLTLSGSQPTADLEVSWQKQPDGWPEAGWICLPFKVEDPRFRLGRLGAPVDPARDLVVDHVNWHNSWVDTGVAVFDGRTGAGVGLCPQDSPTVSLGEPGAYLFHKRHLPQRPHVYVNLHNNHWRTNFASWVGQGERMSSRVRLWSFDKFDAESSLYTPAMEARQPLAAARSTARPGELPPTQAGITLSRKGVAVTAFGPNPDGTGVVLRVWEQGGAAGPLTVTLPAGAAFTQATPVTLRGEPTEAPLEVGHGRLTFHLGAYAPRSFVLE